MKTYLRGFGVANLIRPSRRLVGPRSASRGRPVTKPLKPTFSRPFAFSPLPPVTSSNRPAEQGGAVGCEISNRITHQGHQDARRHQALVMM